MTVVRFRPDPVLSPSTMLASVLVPVLEPGLSEVDLLVEKEKLASRLSSPDMVALLARRLAERCPDGLLIFADQFEEIAATDPESARALLQLLISLDLLDAVPVGGAVQSDLALLPSCIRT